eukprot:m.171060 g.171060  ORF g.171060 m.171060 type:complete len:1108 (+) comp31630_c1_seq1:384-3707(+)
MRMSLFSGLMIVSVSHLVMGVDALVCEDSSTTCASWKAAGYCTLPSAMTYMEQQCSRTCAFCIPAIPTARPTPLPPCVDDSEKCAAWASLDYCTLGGGWAEYMQNSCRKACKFCYDPDDTTTTTTPAPDSECQDYKDECAGWVQADHCYRGGGWAAFMKQFCAKSCNRCDSLSPTTAMPTDVPTALPTPAPSGSPTPSPTVFPTATPTTLPTTTPTRLPSNSPTLPPTSFPTKKPSESPCRDLQDPAMCLRWHEVGFCNTKQAQELCALTCDFCSVKDDGTIEYRDLEDGYDEEQERGVPVVDACNDRMRACITWKTAGFCMQVTAQDYMSSNCRESCGYCSQSPTAAPISTLSPTPATLTPTHAPSAHPTKAPTPAPTTLTPTKPPTLLTNSPVSSSPTMAPTQCANHKASCAQWVTDGHCSIGYSLAYMQEQCSLACGWCKVEEKEPETCVDHHTQCYVWANIGHCDAGGGWLDYMTRTCPKACRMCVSEEEVFREEITTMSPSTSPPTTSSPSTSQPTHAPSVTPSHEPTAKPTTAPIDSPSMSPTTCVDLHGNRCVFYKRSGHCTDTYAEYMMEICAKTCEFCGPTRPPSWSTPTIDPTRFPTPQPTLVPSTSSPTVLPSSASPSASPSDTPSSPPSTSPLSSSPTPSPTNILSTSTTFPPVTLADSTSSTTTTEDSVCFDILASGECLSWKKAGYCWTDVFKAECSKTCGYCSTVVDTPTPTSQPTSVSAVKVDLIGFRTPMAGKRCLDDGAKYVSPVSHLRGDGHTVEDCAKSCIAQGVDCVAFVVNVNIGTCDMFSTCKKTRLVATTEQWRTYYNNGNAVTTTSMLKSGKAGLVVATTTISPKKNKVVTFGSKSTSSSASSTPQIVGAVVGCTILLVLILVGVAFWHFRKENKTDNAKANSDADVGSKAGSKKHPAVTQTKLKDNHESRLLNPLYSSDRIDSDEYAPKIDRSKQAVYDPTKRPAASIVSGSEADMDPGRDNVFEDIDKCSELDWDTNGDTNLMANQLTNAMEKRQSHILNATIADAFGTPGDKLDRLPENPDEAADAHTYDAREEAQQINEDESAKLEKRKSVRFEDETDTAQTNKPKMGEYVECDSPHE